MNSGLLSGMAGLLLDTREWLGLRTYAQEGEDRILARYFHSARSGFFVDVGAHHPFRFSNTYLLYRRGWRGVNIDAMPGSMRRFRRYRPRDINLETAVGSITGAATYFMFNEPALNTFERALVPQRQVPPYRLVAEQDIPVRRLGDILADVVPTGQSIELLTIDVEGRDLDVLRSNDWSRFRPKMVLAETAGKDLAQLHTEPATAFLHTLGYAIAAKTFNTTFMIDTTTRAPVQRTEGS